MPKRQLAAAFHNSQPATAIRNQLATSAPWQPPSTAAAITPTAY